ncbi:MAG TPA: hypothetical protein VHK68_01435, partial [Gemmatimonadales bacterium]|nr:hypothetical protein [Gemmatimonadales bacterium]
MQRTSLVSIIVLAGGLVATLSVPGESAPGRSGVRHPPPSAETPMRGLSQEQLQLLTGRADLTSTLTFVGIQPCRVVDTRGNGFTGDYGSPNLSVGVPRTFVMTGTLTGVPVQCGIPTTAKAVALNATAVATGGTGNIQLYPTGSPPAVGSTVNFRAGINTSNAAIIALGASGDMDA